MVKLELNAEQTDVVVMLLDEKISDYESWLAWNKAMENPGLASAMREQSVPLVEAQLDIMIRLRSEIQLQQ